jgi:hypothetical protein
MRIGAARRIREGNVDASSLIGGEARGDRPG